MLNIRHFCLKNKNPNTGKRFQIFLDDALKEWLKLDATIGRQFKDKLAERLKNTRVPVAKLHGAKDRYKFKLGGVGYRLVYEGATMCC